MISENFPNHNSIPPQNQIFCASELRDKKGQRVAEKALERLEINLQRDRQKRQSREFLKEKIFDEV